MEVKRDQALALKKELEDGLEKWSKQVLEVQENNLKRAEEKVEDRNKLRRQRSREERRSSESSKANSKSSLASMSQMKMVQKLGKSSSSSCSEKTSFVLSVQLLGVTLILGHECYQLQIQPE